MCDCSNRVSRCIGILFLVLVGTTTHTAEAQRSGRSGLRLGHVTALQLLVLEDVRKELQLSDDETAKISAI